VASNAASKALSVLDCSQHRALFHCLLIFSHVWVLLSLYLGLSLVQDRRKQVAAEEITEANLALVALFRPFRELGDHAVTLDRTVGVVTKAVFEALAIPAPQGPR